MQQRRLQETTTLSYRIKSIFFTLQGEGAHQGRPAVFCRFSRCNLWTGREADRDRAVCRFCDTDFLGTDGPGGGLFPTDEALVAACVASWPGELPARHPEAGAWLVLTGGEPALQVNTELISRLQAAGFSVAIETNGTLPIPENLDWVCVSPKANTQLRVTESDELKLVYPQPDLLPEQLSHFRAPRRYLSPMANPLLNPAVDLLAEANLQAALDYCLQHPSWRLTQQWHKHLEID